jgi:hypothetical protein
MRARPQPQALLRGRHGLVQLLLSTDKWLRVVRILVEPKRHSRAADQDRPLDEVGLLHHQVDGFFLGFRQRPRLEHGAAGAHELQEPIGLDVLLEKRAIRRIPVDVTFFDVDLLLSQKTSGVSAGRSRGLQVEDRLGHARIVRLGHGTIEAEPRC